MKFSIQKKKENKNKFVSRKLSNTLHYIKTLQYNILRFKKYM